MKKKWIILLMLCMSMSSLVAWGNGYDNNFKIRIGIFFGSGAKSSYTIGGSGLYVIAGNQAVWQTGATQMQVSRATVYYANQPQASYEAAASGGSLVYYHNGAFFPASLSPSAGYSATGQADILIAANDGRSLALVGNVDQYIASVDEVVSINGTKYRERVNILNNGKSLLAINVLGLDHYLMGVVPKEMSPSWPSEALLAQSIVARNYALSNINKHRASGFNLCNTTSCQVYGGMSAETQQTNAAVMQTSGVLMYHNGYLVEGYFHASSGGRTESSSNAWGGWKPYLTGMDDPFSLGSPHDLWVVQMSGPEIRQRLASSGVNIGEVTGLTISKVSDNGRVMELVVHGSGGSHTIKKDRIRSFLGSSKFKSTFFTIGNPTLVAGAVKKETTPSQENKSASLDSIFEGLSKVMDKQKLTKEPEKNPPKEEQEPPKAVSQPTQPSPVTMVPSTGKYQPQFVPQPIAQNLTVMGNQFVFYGRGYGHGVGMSQYGAKGMASRGYNHQDILRYYFKGVTISR